MGVASFLVMGTVAGKHFVDARRDIIESQVKATTLVEKYMSDENVELTCLIIGTIESEKLGPARGRIESICGPLVQLRAGIYLTKL